MELFRQLATHDNLLAIGVTLIMAGVFMRGFATSSRRELALRRQHALDERQSEDGKLNRQLGRPPGWLDRNLGSLAGLTLTVGIVLSVIAFFRD